ncbi:MAG: hypothetical protein JO067_11230 [Cupriavidus sp.]|nr:hypothetical protein [Cupriavidus sp.]
MSEKAFIRLRTLCITFLLLLGATITYSINLKPRPWDCGSAEKSIAGCDYVIEICDMPSERVSHLNDARVRVYNRAGALLAQRRYHFEPYSPLNGFAVGDDEIRFTDANKRSSDGSFEVQTLAFPPTRADWRAALFESLFFDR